MNEPSYTYVKGQGWVVSRGIAFIKDGYLVTVEGRIPTDGERGFTEPAGRTLEESANNIRTKYRHRPPEIGTLMDDMEYKLRLGIEFSWITVTCQKI